MDPELRVDLWISSAFPSGLCFKLVCYSISYQPKYQKAYYILSVLCLLWCGSCAAQIMLAENVSKTLVSLEDGGREARGDFRR